MPATEPTIDQIFMFSDSGGTADALEIKPVYTDKKLTDKKDDWKAIRDWVDETIDFMVDSQRMRTVVQVKNLSLWLSIHWSSQTRTGDFLSTSNDEITVDSHKITINNIYDIERNRYSKISRNNPQTRVTPRSSDYGDYVGARIGDAVLKSAKERVGQRRKVNCLLRESFIFGESWVKTFWNKEKGMVDPRWETCLKKLRKGEESREFEIDGETILVERDNPIFIGDHDLDTKLPWNLWVDPKQKPEMVEWIIEEEYIHIDTAKMMWPKKANKLEANKDGYRVFNANTLFIDNYKNHVRVRTCHIRSGKFVQEAMKFVCAEGVMLEPPKASEVPMCPESEWGDLPFERLTDIDVPGRLHGYSTIQILSNLQHTENQMLTMIKHYLLMLGHPKMLIPRDAKINTDEMSDGSFYIEYSGDKPPGMLVPNPVPPQVVSFAEYVRDKMQKLGDLHDVSSGELPSGVKAARAIRLLQELEDLRATSNFTKYNDIYLALDRKILLQTTNYRDSDNRLVFLLGKGNEFLVKDFKASELSKNCQVILEIIGMLPQQPSARVEVLSNMYQMTQGQLFPNEKWAKLFGFEAEHEFLDNATVAVVKAQRENDLFIENKKVDSPVPFENHLVEIKEHAILIQSANFRILPEKAQERILAHVMTHELLVYLHMQVNPSYQQQVLMTCPWYPLVFKLPKDTTAQMGQSQQGNPQQPNNNKPAPAQSADSEG